METHADGSEIYIGLDNQFSGFKKLLNKPQEKQIIAFLENILIKTQ